MSRLPRGRRLAPLAGAPRRGVRAPRLAGRAPGARLRGRPCSCRSAASPGRVDEHGRPRVNATALLAGSSSIYQALRAGRRARRADGRRRSPSGSWPPAGSATRCASTATCSWTSRTFSMDWYYPVLGGARPRRRGPGAARSTPLGRLRGARPRRPLRRHQPVGDRRGDLRAGAGAGRARRPRRARCGCSRDMQHLRDDGRLATGPATSSPTSAIWPAEHTTYTAAAVVLAVDALAADDAGLGIFRGSSLAREFPELALECGCGSADASPARRAARSTRIEPSAADLGERRRPPPAGRRRYGGLAAVGRVREHVVDRQRRRRGTPSGRTRRSRCVRVLVGVPAVDEQQRQRRAPVRRDGRRPADHRDHLVLEAGLLDGAPEGGQGVQPAELRVDERRVVVAPSRPGSPPSRGGGRR